MGKREYRDIDGKGGVRLMACGEGYAMVRRRGCAPFVISINIWNLAPPEEKDIRND